MVFSIQFFNRFPCIDPGAAGGQQGIIRLLAGLFHPGNFGHGFVHCIANSYGAVVAHDAAIEIYQRIRGNVGDLVGPGILVGSAWDHAGEAFADDRKRDVHADAGKDGCPSSVGVDDRADIGTFAVNGHVHGPLTGGFAPGGENGLVQVGHKAFPTAGVLQVLLEAPGGTAGDIDESGLRSRTLVSPDSPEGE